MLLLDTNVLSELMKQRPDPAVTRWILRQDEPAFTTVMSKAEIGAGIALLAEGRRRAILADAAASVFARFGDRILPFGEDAVDHYAHILSRRREAGRPIHTIDLIIAAIARAHDAIVVTRDVGGIELTGVAIIDPWETV